MIFCKCERPWISKLERHWVFWNRVIVRFVLVSRTSSLHQNMIRLVQIDLYFFCLYRINSVFYFSIWETIGWVFTLCWLLTGLTDQMVLLTLWSKTSYLGRYFYSFVVRFFLKFSSVFVFQSDCFYKMHARQPKSRLWMWCHWLLLFD
jgi:hypothetical protein